MGQLIIDLYKQQVRRLFDGEDTIEDFLDEVLNDIDEDGGTHGIIRSSLAEYYIGEGSISIDDFEIEEENFDLLTKSGTFQLTFCVNHYYGCDDMDTFTDDDQLIPFSINTEKWTLVLELPDKPVRDTFEEF